MRGLTLVAMGICSAAAYARGWRVSRRVAASKCLAPHGWPTLCDFVFRKGWEKFFMTRLTGFSYRRKFEELCRNSFCQFDGTAEVEFIVGITTGTKHRRRARRLAAFAQGKISSPEILVRKERF